MTLRWHRSTAPVVRLEHSDPREGYHQDWNTLDSATTVAIEVSNFLGRERAVLD